MAYPNRHICEVLEEMRSCYKTRNFCGLLGLIEEAQSMANRMESGLQDHKDLLQLTKDRARLDKQVRKLRSKRDELQGNDCIELEDIDDEDE